MQSCTQCWSKETMIFMCLQIRWFPLCTQRWCPLMSPPCTWWNVCVEMKVVDLNMTNVCLHRLSRVPRGSLRACELHTVPTENELALGQWQNRLHSFHWWNWLLFLYSLHQWNIFWPWLGHRGQIWALSVMGRKKLTSKGYNNHGDVMGPTWWIEFSCSYFTIPF